ncbi:hypothetical protein [Streptomyces sp. NPDC050560]|uniref:hypothetical protein n=1 Tax=Streptomyces sp. NPDC050560 TaxID=3365630 RepID=UPI0037B68214
MTTRRVRRIVRSAGLLAVAASAALSLTACQDSSKDASADTGKQVSHSASPNSEGKSGGSGSGDSKSGAPESDNAATNGAPAGDSKSAPDTAGKKSSPIRTEPLPDGSKAEIYEVGSQHYLANIISSDGEELASMESDGHDAGLDANAMYIVLSLDGHIHAWTGNDHQGPGTFKVAGGWTVKVTKEPGQNHYRAQIMDSEGTVKGTLDANGHDAGGVANGINMVLSFGGIISAHE